MKRIYELNAEQLRDMHLHDTIVLLGKFDGFHRGHRRLLEKALSLKAEYAASHPKEDGLRVVIFTFDVHPERVIPGSGGQHMQTIQTRKERLEDPVPEEVDYIVEFPFNRETMSREPEQFVKDVLVDRLGVRKIVCGDDFRFGKDRKGNVEMLRELGTQYGFEVYVVPKVTICFEHEDGTREELTISSTLIRKEIRQGHMEHVTAMLGRPFCISGEVQKGKQLGRRIGFPTVNLPVSGNKILPPDGVYATKVTVFIKPEALRTRQDQDVAGYYGVTNLGRRPTFQDGDFRTVETYLFDFSGDLYGKEITVDFCHFIRPERRFENVRKLVEQMKKDVATAKAFFSDNL